MFFFLLSRARWRLVRGSCDTSLELAVIQSFLINKWGYNVPSNDTFYELGYSKVPSASRLSHL